MTVGNIFWWSNRCLFDRDVYNTKTNALSFIMTVDKTADAANALFRFRVQKKRKNYLSFKNALILF